MSYNSKGTLSLTLHLISDCGFRGDMKNGNTTKRWYFNWLKGPFSPQGNILNIGKVVIFICQWKSSLRTDFLEKENTGEAHQFIA